MLVNDKHCHHFETHHTYHTTECTYSLHFPVSSDNTPYVLITNYSCHCCCSRCPLTLWTRTAIGADLCTSLRLWVLNGLAFPQSLSSVPMWGMIISYHGKSTVWNFWWNCFVLTYLLPQSVKLITKARSKRQMKEITVAWYVAILELSQGTLAAEINRALQHAWRSSASWGSAKVQRGRKILWHIITVTP